ncbi:MAG: GWxTD domain-containing protein [bacterium]
MRKKGTVLLVVIGVAFAMGLSGQTLAPRAILLLNLDYSRFRYDDQSGYLEVYYSFHPKQLTYHIEDGKFNGGVKILTKISKSGTNESIVNQESPLNISEADTSGVWYRFPFVSQAGYAIPQGKWDVRVMAWDLFDPSRRDSLQLNLNIEPYGSVVAMSDVELCQNIINSDQREKLYYKNSLEVVPYPSLVFGAATIPVVFYYVELYNVSPGVDYTMNTEILDANGTSLRQIPKPRTFASANSVEVGTIPVTAYASGKYALRLTLLDGDQNEVVKTVKTFFIFNPQIQAAQQMVGIDKGVFEDMTEQELDQEFEYAKYLVVDEEKRMYGQLNTKVGKSELLFDFWVKVGKGRRDFPPILRDEYLTRVVNANEKFTAFRKKGWLSDRGRVYLIYGEPSEIDRAPSQPDSKPYEAWRYHQIENGVEFIFLDRYGMGQLELVHSTKRGELRDETWTRFLAF